MKKEVTLLLLFIFSIGCYDWGKYGHEYDDGYDHRRNRCQGIFPAHPFKLVSDTVSFPDLGLEILVQSHVFIFMLKHVSLLS